MRYFINNNTVKLDEEAGYKEIEEDDIMFDAPCNTCVHVIKTASVNEQNNPILNVSIYKDGKEIKEYQALSGRAWTQNLDRNISGNHSPSPKGKYSIGVETVGTIPETGGVFLPYYPNFNTERSALGVHWDPSWGLDNGEDGTSGCIAFKTLEEFKQFAFIIKNDNIKELVIDY